VNEKPHNKNALTELKMTMDEAHDAWGHKTASLLNKTAKEFGIKLTGELTPCEGCAYAKSRQKRVQKNTNNKADKPGERIFIDTAGPFHETPGGTRYWTQMVDDFSSYGWVEFHHHKSKILDRLRKTITECEGKQYAVKYIRADNAGENEKPLMDYCREKGIELELTASNTPQLNGRVERRIAVITQRANAQMFAAGLNESTRKILWAESVNTANFIENVTVNSVRKVTAYELFHGHKPKVVKFLQPFGRLGVVAKRETLKTKFAHNGTKLVHVGQAINRPGDTYRMYNPATKKCSNTRDITWMAFTRPDPKRDLSIFIKDPSLTVSSVGIEDREVPDLPQAVTPRAEAQVGTANLEIDAIPTVATIGTPPRRARLQAITQNLPDVTPDVPTLPLARTDREPMRQPILDPIPRRMTTRSQQGKNTTETVPTFQQRDKVAKVNRELRRLSAPTVPDPTSAEVPLESMATQPIENDDPHAQDSTEQVNFIFSEWIMKTESIAIKDDYATPRNIKEALSEPWAQEWIPSVKNEIMNFIKRGSWKFVPKSLPKSLNRKVMKTTAVFKVKDEPDGSKRRKTRICSKGFMQIPGVDFTESYSPVVNDASMRIVFALYLTKHGDWTIECIDIEAAFLEGNLQRKCFIEIPDGVVQLGFISEEEAKDSCIELLKGMYGNVDAALMFFITYKNYLMEELKMKQCRCDPCIFYKVNGKEETILIAMIYVDDTILMGPGGEVEWYKEKIGKRFGYTSQGGIKKHLGITYELKMDDEEQPLWELTANKLVQDIIDRFKEATGKSPKDSDLPATPGHTTLKHDGDPIQPSDYRSIVGKIMYLVVKLMPEGANAARELSRQFGNPSKEHWKELEKFVGYLNKNPEVKLTIRRPKELRAAGMFDSNFASNPIDRKSVSAHDITIGGALVDWGSKTQPTVATSTTEAEYQSLAAGTGGIRHAQYLLEEIAQNDLPGVACEDNDAAAFMVKNSQVSQRTKHIDVKYHYIRELRERGLVEPIRVDSENNNSDCHTKNLPKALFVKHREAFRSGRNYIYENWEDIVLSVRNGMPNNGQREDVKDFTISYVHSIESEILSVHRTDLVNYDYYVDIEE
jgi:hypothetical protein